MATASRPRGDRPLPLTSVCLLARPREQFSLWVFSHLLGLNFRTVSQLPKGSRMWVGNLGNIAKFHQEESSGKRQICICPHPKLPSPLKPIWNSGLGRHHSLACWWQGSGRVTWRQGCPQGHIGIILGATEIWAMGDKRGPATSVPPGMQQRKKGLQSARMVLPAPYPHPRGPLSDLSVS